MARPVLGDLKQRPEGLLLLATDFLNTGDKASAAQLVEDWSRLASPPSHWTLAFAILLAQSGLPAEAESVLLSGAGPKSGLLRNSFQPGKHLADEGRYRTRS